MIRVLGRNPMEVVNKVLVLKVTGSRQQAKTERRQKAEGTKQETKKEKTDDGWV
jgi:hypothetical protein